MWDQPFEGVFVLAAPGPGTFTADCTIREGKAILASPGGYLNWDTSKALARQTYLDGLYPLVKDPNVVVDGVAVSDPDQFYIEQRHPYRLTIGQFTGDPLGPPGKYWALDYGWPVVIKPLAAGNHTIVLSDQLPNADGSVYDVAQITYHIHVVGHRGNHR